jgi:hypothetical protein
MTFLQAQGPAIIVQGPYGNHLRVFSRFLATTTIRSNVVLEGSANTCH